MKNKKIVEIEIKVKVEKIKKLLEFLKKNAKFQKETRQVDEYFTPSHRNFLNVRPVKEWFRIRHADSVSLNYKKFYYEKDGSSHHSDEYEIKIDDYSHAKKMLKALNFQSIAIVDKIRKTWKYNNWEIALDYIKNLGEFVEIELIEPNSNPPKKTTEEMVAFLKKTDCGKIQRNYQGYPFLLLFKKEIKFEEE